MVTGGLSSRDGIDYYRIDGVEQMPPFLMTVVSDSDLWMFVSSTGALTAGRIDADHSLFPYETDDRVHRNVGLAGPITVIARNHDSERQVWRPFDRDTAPGCERSIAKSVLGDRLVFEEHHAGWELTYRATWAPSDLYGWVRSVEMIDHAGDDEHDVEYEVLDGLLDVMPAGIDAHIEQIRSNLADAYKRSEVGPWGTLAIYSLESLVSDRAEPAEALTATVVWSSGFDGAELGLDPDAVGDMIEGRPSPPSHLLTGRPGAYLLRGSVSIPASGSARWMMVADTILDHAGVLRAAQAATRPGVIADVGTDVELGTRRLEGLLAGADAFQATGDDVADAHHLSNVLFNSMRGGVFPYGHQVPIEDLATFVEARNRSVSERHRTWFVVHGESSDVSELRRAALATGDPDLIRLVLEYLPLTFSRRHGDPSRPWNRFSINVRNDNGDQLLSYEGNWRDIFQNWEALLQSYPAYLPHVVAKFVNASTIEGYNPYRISRSGFDWEVPDPDDPWSHIGYWGDHQIIYLLRLLETWEQHAPGEIVEWLDRPVFVYADVPYTLADHEAIVDDPRNTITYDEQHAERIAARELSIGADGRLLAAADQALVRVGLAEKLVVPALAKLSNWVPGGGIWLNTQRPEWNDANNALAGPGLSMVTLYHLRRYLDVVGALIERAGGESTTLSSSVAEWMADVLAVLDQVPSDVHMIDDRQRRSIVDSLGRSAAAHRRRVASGNGNGHTQLPFAEVARLCKVSCELLDASIRSARRDDGLYHSYNRVSFPTGTTAQVDHLGPMLEGQVAVVSSGTLDGAATVSLLDALFSSAMYRPDQQSFMLYPATRLRPFLDRNQLTPEAAQRIAGSGLGEVFYEDDQGGMHFRPEIINATELAAVLERTGASDVDRAAVFEIHEQVFDHSSFTGRSGSMYGYEGLGSVYWHMVAKLLLAVQETYWLAIEQPEPEPVVWDLAAAYRRIRSGLGYQKDPALYGAIPTDCYSHTPGHAGAQQPGMTGQVKEEVLTRFGELGVRVVHGRVHLMPGLITADEVFPAAAEGVRRQATFTYCSVPMSIAEGESDSVVVLHVDGTRETVDRLELSTQQSQLVFDRSASIDRVEWTVGPDTMRRWTSLDGGTDA